MTKPLFFSESKTGLQYCYDSNNCYGKKKEGFDDKLVTQDKCCKSGGSWGVSGTDHCVTCPEDGEQGMCF